MYARLARTLAILLPGMAFADGAGMQTGAGSWYGDSGGSRFTLGEDVDSAARARRGDIILYYNILDTAASVDVGMNARHIEGNKAISISGGSTGTNGMSGWLPMLYASVDLDLPLTGLSVGASGSLGGYHGRQLYDVRLQASYVTPWKAGIDLGYRHLDAGLDTFDEVDTDAGFSGSYAGIFLDF